jgi:hypothetical protein
MNEGSRDRNHSGGEYQSCASPAWLISAEELEDELLAAILADRGAHNPALTVIDEYFSGDDDFEDADHWQILLWLLSLLRPRLADLLGGPSAD